MIEPKRETIVRKIEYRDALAEKKQFSTLMGTAMRDADEHAERYFEKLERERGMESSFIYGLVDPRTDQIRYIGKSIRPYERLQNHYNEPSSNCHRSHWIQELKRLGLKPEVVLFEQIVGEWPWQEAERWWIARGLALGWPLTNNTSGGDGVCNLPPETREKMRRTWLGRKHKPETLLKLSARSRGRIATAETRAKHSRSMRGRKITWVDAIAESNRKLSAEQVEHIEARLAAGERNKDLAKEFGVHRTTLSKITIGTYFTQKRGANANG